ncbi:hypothetical protein LAX75_01820 [Listeria cossartiae]|uniref:hypothetical protein n=1 Tax=Listeria cossartiae TaxID=2838249 RepID=UPI001E2E7A68|nr:hypothetical protein [Listeria cossartiae]MCD2223417.1 hypothetical protein [Listeria cossartiae]MCD2238095.1 hypothetical protein [Listeria cossartiae]
MLVEKSIAIANNDIYEIGVTKDYIIINDNYTGIVVYDKKCNRKCSIKIDENLMIYQLYTSLLNNFVVIFDAENEKMYVVNLLNRTVENLDIDEVIFGDYYFVNADNFILRAASMEYTFSFEKPRIIKISVFSRTDNYFLMANSQEENVFRSEKGSIYYNYEENMVELLGNNAIDNLVSINQKNILIYDELILLTYENLRFKEEYKIPDEFSLRRALFSTEKILVLLLNEKKDILKSRIHVCLI